MDPIIIIIIISVILSIFAAYNKLPEVKGRRAENNISRIINFQIIPDRGGCLLTNLYIPRNDEGTSEIDAVYVTEKGVFVIESKNYMGYIFGNDRDKQWTVTLFGGKGTFGQTFVKKYRFYNPVWQNKTHIKCLKDFLSEDIPCHSLIVFSNRGELKNISISAPDTYVCYQEGLTKTIEHIWQNSPVRMDAHTTNQIYQKLLPLTQKNSIDKKRHIESIQKRFSNNICPSCGGILIVRTAKKGKNAGNRFYGCTNYPKCRYTRPIDD